jgi:hypothetical protein
MLRPLTRRMSRRSLEHRPTRSLLPTHRSLVWLPRTPPSPQRHRPNRPSPLRWTAHRPPSTPPGLRLRPLRRAFHRVSPSRRRYHARASLRRSPSRPSCRIPVLTAERDNASRRQARLPNALEGPGRIRQQILREPGGLCVIQRTSEHGGRAGTVAEIGWNRLQPWLLFSVLRVATPRRYSSGCCPALAAQRRPKCRQLKPAARAPVLRVQAARAAAVVGTAPRAGPPAASSSLRTACPPLLRVAATES